MFFIYFEHLIACCVPCLLFHMFLRVALRNVKHWESYFAEIVNNFKPLTIFAKYFIVDVWQGSEYAFKTVPEELPLFTMLQVVWFW